MFERNPSNRYNYEKKGRRDMFSNVVNGIIALVAILVVVSIGINIAGMADGNSTVSFGIGGIIEQRCMNGMLFTIDQTGNARQVIDEFGKGLRCGSK